MISNTPEAYSVLFDMAREVSRLKSEDMAAANALASHLRKLSSVLGLLEQEPDAFLQSGAQADDGEVAEIEALINARLEARQAKDWSGSRCGAQSPDRDGGSSRKMATGDHLAP